MTRRLVSIRRFVPDDVMGYDEAWARLHAAATARGAHAWRFASADAPGVYLEFLEFGDESDIRADGPTLEAIRALHTGYGQVYPMPQTLEEWMEAPVGFRSPPPPPAPGVEEAAGEVEEGEEWKRGGAAPDGEGAP